MRAPPGEVSSLSIPTIILTLWRASSRTWRIPAHLLHSPQNASLDDLQPLAHREVERIEDMDPFAELRAASAQIRSFRRVPRDVYRHNAAAVSSCRWYISTKAPRTAGDVVGSLASEFIRSKNSSCSGTVGEEFVAEVENERHDRMSYCAAMSAGISVCCRDDAYLFHDAP